AGTWQHSRGGRYRADTGTDQHAAAGDWRIRHGELLLISVHASIVCACLRATGRGGIESPVQDRCDVPLPCHRTLPRAAGTRSATTDSIAPARWRSCTRPVTMPHAGGAVKEPRSPARLSGHSLAHIRE